MYSRLPYMATIPNTFLTLEALESLVWDNKTEYYRLATERNPYVGLNRILNVT